MKCSQCDGQGWFWHATNQGPSKLTCPKCLGTGTLPWQHRYATLAAWCHWKRNENMPDDDKELVKDVEDLLSLVGTLQAKLERTKANLTEARQKDREESDMTLDRELAENARLRAENEKFRLGAIQDDERKLRDEKRRFAIELEFKDYKAHYDRLFAKGVLVDQQEYAEQVAERARLASVEQELNHRDAISRKETIELARENDRLREENESLAKGGASWAQNAEKFRQKLAAAEQENARLRDRWLEVVEMLDAKGMEVDLSVEEYSIRAIAIAALRPDPKETKDG